jgi:hypothetical protein
VQSEHLFHEYLAYIYRLAGRFDWDEMSRLAQFIHHHRNGIILFGSSWQSCDKIHGDGFPFPLWDG